jgi:hypothetical protein
LTRGVKANIGDESIINGYVYVKVEEDEWKPKARIVMEEHLGRDLYDNEYIRFADRNPLNLAISNLQLHTAKAKSLQAELTKLREKRIKIDTRIAAIERSLGLIDEV